MCVRERGKMTLCGVWVCCGCVCAREDDAVRCLCVCARGKMMLCGVWVCCGCVCAHGKMTLCGVVSRGVGGKNVQEWR